MDMEDEDGPPQEYLIDMREFMRMITSCACGKGNLRVNQFCVGCGNKNPWFDKRLLETNTGKKFEDLLAECPAYHNEIRADHILSVAEGDVKYGPDLYCNHCGFYAGES